MGKLLQIVPILKFSRILIHTHTRTNTQLSFFDHIMMINCDNTRATMLQALLIGLLVASTHAVGTEMGSSELATLFQEHDWTFDEYKPRDRKGKVIHTISLEAPRPWMTC